MMSLFKFDGYKIYIPMQRHNSTKVINICTQTYFTIGIFHLKYIRYIQNRFVNLQGFGRTDFMRRFFEMYNS